MIQLLLLFLLSDDSLLALNTLQTSSEEFYWYKQVFDYSILKIVPSRDN